MSKVIESALNEHFGSQPAPGIVEVQWVMRVRVGSGCHVAEVPAWGDKVVISDVSANTTMADLAIQTSGMLGSQIVETLLSTCGAAERDGHGFLKGMRAKVSIERS